MGKDSVIQWTDVTWNIARGCDKVSEGCKFCYMMRDSLNNTRYIATDVVRTKTVFNLPLRLKEPQKIFTCSLTDFFHEKIDSFREEAWEIIRQCPHHTFQILTKRPERIENCLPFGWNLGWDNVILMFSAENQKTYLERFHHMSWVRSIRKGISIEPLLGPIDLSLAFEWWKQIHWVIIGGESGFGKYAEDKSVKWQYRECHFNWIEDIVRQCREKDVPVFVKQMGTHLAKVNKMSDNHGGNFNDFPEELKVRQFPYDLIPFSLKS